MTGLEFKQTAAVWAALAIILLLLPAVIITGLRRYAKCETGYGSGRGRASTSLVFVGCFLLLYIVLVYKQWDDGQRIGFLLGYPLPQAVLAAVNALAVVLLSSLFGRWVPAREPHICRELFPCLLAVFGLLWFDISRNERSLLVSWLQA